MSGRRSVSIRWRNAIRDSSLDRTAKLVAFVLSTFFNAAGYARVSKETLAAGGSVTDRAVDSAINRIEEAGFLTVARSNGGNGWTNEYFANILQPGTPFPVRPRKRGTARHVAGNATPLSGERRSHESAESAESGNGGLREDAAAVEIINDCLRCNAEFTGAPDDAYCPQCREAGA
jgi:hypothetical protein